MTEKLGKARYWGLAENFREKWNSELSLHFSKDQAASTLGQLIKL